MLSHRLIWRFCCLLFSKIRHSRNALASSDSVCVPPINLAGNGRIDVQALSSFLRWLSKRLVSQLNSDIGYFKHHNKAQTSSPLGTKNLHTARFNDTGLLLNVSSAFAKFEGCFCIKRIRPGLNNQRLLKKPWPVWLNASPSIMPTRADMPT